MTAQGKYTCNEYRQEMMLLGLKRRLEDPEMSEAEKKRLYEKVCQLERQMGMD
jgi:hypothetical protein